jgi:hypothetical protein
VPDAARVGAGPDAEDGDVGAAGPEAGVQEVHDVGWGEGPLIKEQELVLAALAACGVDHVLGVPEHDQRAVAEAELPVGAVPHCSEGAAVVRLGELGDEGLGQFTVGASERSDA